MSMRRDGFTMVEVTVVLVILAITGAILYPSLRATLDKARMDASVRDLASLLKYARRSPWASRRSSRWSCASRSRT